MSRVEADVVAINVDVAARATGGTSIARHYYELTKPGISQMVAMSTLAGYYLAIPGSLTEYATAHGNWWHFLATIIGTIAVSSGSCVVNHIIERDADSRMQRTSQRPIPAGIISVRAASIFAAVLTLVGLALIATTNTLTLVLAITTWLLYVAVYTPMKSRSSLAVVIGGIPGALPFAGGWTAVTGSMDIMAWALFAILFFWQLPHFYALSWMYRRDYSEGGFVLRSTTDSNASVLGWQMVATSVLTAACLAIPTYLNGTGMIYAIGSSVLGAWMVVESIRFLRTPNSATARRTLLTSYAVLMGVFLLMFVDKQ